MARAVVSTMPRIATALMGDPDRAARSYARFGITREMFRHGVPSEGRVDSNADRAHQRSVHFPLREDHALAEAFHSIVR